ncbi:hypothetical protein MMC06_002663 [Schaereria dolodes]|nr:hypothetical protein [Schaereria dolodes]
MPSTLELSPLKNSHGPPSTPYEGVGGRAQPGYGDKENKRQNLPQKHTEEMIVKRGRGKKSKKREKPN